MASDKENNPNASSDPGPRPGTKLANSTSALSLRDDAVDEKTNKLQLGPKRNPHDDALDAVVVGGCSTCASHEHPTVKCDREPPPKLLMSGALQTDLEGFTKGTDRVEANLTGPGRRIGRRNSV
ncbi:hypothetical protein DHEL01_v203310 [Diaporthe helianthi]|uniref:Uncharacterized protein n=1 Tax=Diaporthe helianthi TaxID=158607 RepID=A0A2P5I701_DIAHE|nr:hypothetical protein DHEL01_v203310 [Diaporthe helianthi]